MEFMFIVGAVVFVMVWNLLSAALIADSVWHEADQNKAVWVFLQAGALVVLPIGWLVTVIYLVAVRPELRAAKTRADAVDIQSAARWDTVGPSAQR